MAACYHGNQVKKSEKNSNKVSYLQFTIKIDLNKIFKFLSNFHSYFRRNLHTIDRQHYFLGAFGIGWREQYAHEGKKESLMTNTNINYSISKST